MKTLFFLITFAVLSSCNYAYGQCPVMPTGFLCISQAAGNQAASNTRELEATKAKVVTLESALTDKDKTISEIKATAAKNEADLKAALSETQTKLGTATGQLIGEQAANVRNLAVIDVLLRSTRMKCSPFSVCIGH